jgi:hypothetical protein
MSELSRDVLLANCRIRSGNVGGSGTVIYSMVNVLPLDFNLI